MHVGNKTEEGSFQLYRTAVGKNSAVSYYKYSPHIQQGEKTKSEKRREIEDVKKDSSGSFRAERYSIGNKKHTG